MAMTAERTCALEEAGINYADALERFGGNEALYARLAVKYANDPHFAALEEALTADDTERAFSEAHALKGVAGNLSFAALYNTATKACEDLRAGDLEAGRAHLPALRAEHEAVLGALGSLTN